MITLTSLLNTGCRYARSIDISGNFDFPTDLYHVCPSVYHTKHDDMMRLGKLFLELQPSSPQVFMIMGHSYELAVGDRWDRLEEFLQLVSHQNDIFYGTCNEILLNDHTIR